MLCNILIHGNVSISLWLSPDGKGGAGAVLTQFKTLLFIPSLKFFFIILSLSTLFWLISPAQHFWQRRKKEKDLKGQSNTRIYTLKPKERLRQHVRGKGSGKERHQSSNSKGRCLSEMEFCDMMLGIFWFFIYQTAPVGPVHSALAGLGIIVL